MRFPVSRLMELQNPLPKITHEPGLLGSVIAQSYYCPCQISHLALFSSLRCPCETGKPGGTNCFSVRDSSRPTPGREKRRLVFWAIFLTLLMIAAAANPAPIKAAWEELSAHPS